MISLRGLFVFEGPDGVGKTSIGSRVARALRRDGHDVLALSFPGKQAGTLGALVYRIHHDRAAFGIQQLSEEARQLLHVAAHLDAIKYRIRPALERGKLVLLDRFWWSTTVYGSVGGADRHILDRILSVELQAWGDILPKGVFLIRRPTPFRSEADIRTWRRLSSAYRALAAKESERYVVEQVVNDGPLSDVVSGVVRRLLTLARTTQKAHAERPASRQLALDLMLDTPMRRPIPSARRFWSPAEPTVVFDTYWHFAAERQRIFFRRVEGSPCPWTNDPILQVYKFTNAYRAADRVSQFLIRNVIYRGSTRPEEIFFRTILFKLFNRIATWELLEREIGPLSLTSFSVSGCGHVMRKEMERGERIYSGAYIMPAAERAQGILKHDTHLRLLARMVDEGLPGRLAQAGLLREAFEMIRSYPMMGDFLAYQYVIDLNYSPLLDFSEMEFVVPGPGARDGMAKCFRSLGGLSEAEIIHLVTRRQAEEFARVDEDFQSLWGRPLQLIDCQNLFCEVGKYARLFHPDIRGRSGRERIKQVFRPTRSSVGYWFPPKWGLNDRIGSKQ